MLSQLGLLLIYMTPTNLQCSKKETFRPETGKLIFSTKMAIRWYQNVLGFDHTGEILAMFWGGKFLFFSTVCNL